MGRASALVYVLLIVTLSAFPALSAFAAKQGKAGKTSSATAKITLTIPPYSASSSLVENQKALTARDYLQQLCLTENPLHSATNQNNDLRVSLSNVDNKAMLAAAINAHCQSSFIEADTSKTTKTTVLLFAPR